MTPVVFGGISALSFGVGDFMASHSSGRIGAPRALLGMLLVSTVVLSGILLPSLMRGDLGDASLPGLAFGALHGVTMAFALVLFFHAMAIGRINVVAPIVASHPVLIVLFALVTGTVPSLLQMIAVAAVVLGVGIVSAAGRTGEPLVAGPLGGAPVGQVVGYAIAASVLYAIAIISLQQAVSTLAALPVLWLGRAFGLVTIGIVLLVQRQALMPPSTRWWPFFIAHGLLDSGGLLFLLIGSTGGARDIVAAVVASTFPIITVALAWAIRRERMSPWQILGAAKIFSGVAVLAAADHF